MGGAGLSCDGGPVAWAITLVGAWIGHACEPYEQGRAPAITMLVLLTPSLMALNRCNRAGLPCFRVRQQPACERTATEGLELARYFSHMDDPTELIFRPVSSPSKRGSPSQVSGPAAMPVQHRAFRGAHHRMG